jgi:FAD/FMN-containing dehydrogenase
MGRSYGDSCLNPNGTLWNTTPLNRFIKFDFNAGIISCESGVLLKDVQQLVTQQGWMLPVTPGTQMITIGGAIANDVHGKNHHRMGNFSEHVISIELLRTDGQSISCSPQLNSEYFWATVGGLGLTGLISKVDLQLRRINSIHLDTESIPYGNLDEFIELSNGSENGWEYTVSWIDCLSKKNARGIFMRANHSQQQYPSPQQKNKRSISFTPPISVINKFTLPILNNAYFHINQIKKGKRVTPYQQFFYPLDNINHWNKMYGPKGFYQYQCVVPKKISKDATQLMLNAIHQAGLGSFLAVLKTFGNRPAMGMLSFPSPGITLAIDFPNNGGRTRELFQKLDTIVSEAGGRIYPAKDACMPKSLFESGYPRLPEFLAYRDPGISSALSRRLMGS